MDEVLTGNYNQFTYFSPAQINAIKDGEVSVEEPHSKTTTYNLGVTLLHVALLEDCEDLYVQNSVYLLNVDQNLLNDKLKHVKDIYGEDVKQMLQQMLHIDPMQRVSITQF